MTKDSTRPRRVAELIKRELALRLARELDDPIAQRITLTGAEASPDLCSVRVYFSLLTGSAEAAAAARVLNRAAGGLRHALRRRVSLKRGVPQLRFVFDESLERGARLDALIERAIAESATAPAPGSGRTGEESEQR
jgi:ribosome-binding factor A